MRFYRWESFDPYFEKENLSWTIDVPVDLRTLSRPDGKRIVRWNPKLVAVYPKRPISIDFSRAAASYPIFSPRLRRHFELTHPHLIQFLPFRLQKDDGTSPMHGYSFGKYLKIIECIDRQRTQVDDGDWTLDKGTYHTCGKLCLQRHRIRDAICFMVRGESQYVVVREDLKMDLERGKYVGCLFEEEVRVWPS